MAMIPAHWSALWQPRGWTAASATIVKFPQALAFPDLPVRDLMGLPASLGRAGTLEVRLATTRKEIKKAQRLRFKVFYGEGAAKADGRMALTRRDICRYDRVCDHLVVIDHAARTRRLGRLKPKVVATCRLLRHDVAGAHFGFSSALEFDIAPLLARHPGKRFLELGRSCVLAPYRSKKTLDLLWRGLWAYVRRHDIDAMIGCASFPGTNPLAHARALSFLARHASAEAPWQVSALAARHVPMSNLGDAAIDARRALASLPPLIKGYLRAGARFGDGAVVDRQFGTTDVFVVMPVADIEERYVAHFGAGESADAKAA